jgi:hypothetical protein
MGLVTYSFDRDLLLSIYIRGIVLGTEPLLLKTPSVGGTALTDVLIHNF